MRNLLFVAALFLTSCGQSFEEKVEIAQITCNIIFETRQMDGAERLKEINIAREKIGEELFLGTDDDIIIALSRGLCLELVLGDENYERVVAEQAKAEQAKAEKIKTTERAGVTDESITLGSFSDLSGPVAVWGVGSVNGARMRFAEVNEAGGVHGRQIRFVVEDTSYQVPKAISAANKLINRDNVFAMLLGVGTPMNNALMPTLFDAGVPNLFPISGGRQMVEPFHRLKFSQHGIYYDEARASVKYFMEQLGREVPCVIHVDNDYGIEILAGAKDQAEAMGTSLSAVSAHKPTESEFTAPILRLRKAGCDLVLMGTVHRDTILILDAARKMGWSDVAWVGTNAAYAQVIADQESSEGYYCFVHMAKIYSDDEMSPTVRSWWDKYIELYGTEPGLAAMEGYRGADLTVEALQRAGKDLTTDGLVKAMESIDSYKDIFGYNVSFSADSHKGATESILSQVKNKRWITLQEAITY